MENFFKAVKKPVPVKVKQIDTVTHVDTLEGTMTGQPGDYLVVGNHDDQWIVKKHIFEATYEKLEE